MLFAVNLLEMTHEGREGARIGGLRRLNVRGQCPDGAACLVDHARVFLNVFLDPGRSEVHGAVLKASEPGQNQAQVVRPRPGHQTVERP